MIVKGVQRQHGNMPGPMFVEYGRYMCTPARSGSRGGSARNGRWGWSWVLRRFKYGRVCGEVVGAPGWRGEARDAVAKRQQQPSAPSKAKQSKRHCTPVTSFRHLGDESFSQKPGQHPLEMIRQALSFLVNELIYL